MLEEELEAMNVINDFFSNKDLPMNRIKSVFMQWETVGGANLPIIKCEFYEKFESVLDG